MSAIDPKANASLVPHAVVQLRLLYAAGIAGQATLASAFRIGQQQVSRIIRGESWCDVGGPLVFGRKRRRWT